jgi:hypothetical protein
MALRKKTKKKSLLKDFDDQEISSQDEIKKINEDSKKVAKLSKMYFNNSTQDAIMTYQKSSDKKEKNKLYLEEIMPAFEKLAENLINIHKFTSLYDSYDDLKSDCVNFLFETIHKFDGERGTNAFSYFNVVAKNWLIFKTKQKAQKSRRSVSLDDPDALTSSENKALEEQHIIPGADFIIENQNSSNDMLNVLYEIRSRIKTDSELSCINSIITIFENIEDVDLLNKRAILLYMRELSGLSPKQLTTTMQVVKKHYKKLKSGSELDI